MYNQLMRCTLFFFILLTTSNVAFSNSFYQDAFSSFQNNNFEKTIHLLEKDIVFNPKSSDSYILLGKSYNKISDLEKSYKYFNIAFTLNPENIELNFLLGEKSYELGLIEKYGEYISNLETLCSGDCEEIGNLKDLASE
tara:strand:+ start:95 stop:511 length:417 start_codon:yes stop_codon:yes gene_type:complete